MIWLVALLIGIVSYLLGSIPSGLLISFSRGIDIRQHGSGNIGATNVWRTMGKTWGLLAFLCDFAKGWLAVIAGACIAAHSPVTVHLPHFVTITKWFPRDQAGIAAAIGCILGHNFPIWLRFKGGKGVATSLGVIFGMMPLVALIVLAVWAIVLKASRYVSLASLVGAISLPLVVVALMFFWPLHAWGAVYGWAYFYFAVAAALLVIRRHAPNIRRLINGEEHRFGTPKTSDESPTRGAGTEDHPPVP